MLSLLNLVYRMNEARKALCEAFWEGASAGRRGAHLLGFVFQKFPEASFETVVGAAFAASVDPPSGRDAAHSAIYDVAIKNRGLPQFLAHFD
jgi:hypothetical protein